MKQYRCISLILLLLAEVACCQASVWNDLNGIRQKYNHLTSFSADHTYTLSADDPADRVISVQHGSIAYAPAGYRYVLGDNLFAGNERFVWAVYQDIGEMLVQPSDTSRPATPTEVWDFQKLDALLQQFQVLKVIPPTQAGLRAFRFDFEGNPWMQYRAVDVEYDPATFAVHRVKMVYQYDASHYGLLDDYIPVLTISYQNQRFDPVIAPATFSEQGYFRVSGDKYVAGSPTYRHYQIMTPYE